LPPIGIGYSVASLLGSCKGPPVVAGDDTTGEGRASCGRVGGGVWGVAGRLRSRAGCVFACTCWGVICLWLGFICLGRGWFRLLASCSDLEGNIRICGIWLGLGGHFREGRTRPSPTFLVGDRRACSTLLVTFRAPLGYLVRPSMCLFRPRRDCLRRGGIRAANGAGRRTFCRGWRGFVNADGAEKSVGGRVDVQAFPFHRLTSARHPSAESSCTRQPHPQNNRTQPFPLHRLTSARRHPRLAIAPASRDSVRSHGSDFISPFFSRPTLHHLSVMGSKPKASKESGESPSR